MNLERAGPATAEHADKIITAGKGGLQGG